MILKHSSARQGFTLIECMIAMVIVSVGSVATITLLMNLRIHNHNEQERARAHQIVSEEMDRVQLELYSRVTSNETVTVWDNGTPDDTSDDVTGLLDVTLRDTAGNTLLAAPVPAERVEIEVTLSWVPGGRPSGRTMRESVMAYVAP